MKNHAYFHSYLGKTSLVSFFAVSMAKQAAQRNTENRGTPVFVLPHFIGASPGSPAIRHTLHRLVSEMTKMFRIPIEKIAEEYNVQPC